MLYVSNNLKIEKDPWFILVTGEHKTKYLMLRGLFFKLLLNISHTFIWKILQIWNRCEYLSETEKALGDKKVYKNVFSNSNVLSSFMSSGNKIAEKFKGRKTILKAKMKYFLYVCNNTTDLGKLFSFLKIKKKTL